MRESACTQKVQKYSLQYFYIYAYSSICTVLPVHCPTLKANAPFPFNSLTLTRNEHQDQWLLRRMRECTSWAQLVALRHLGFHQVTQCLSGWRVILPWLYSPGYPKIGGNSAVCITAERGSDPHLGWVVLWCYWSLHLISLEHDKIKKKDQIHLWNYIS